MGAQGQAQAPQQHGDVGALGAVVGVELIEDQVGQGGGRGPPQLAVLGAQEQLVEHLVVGEQDVRRVVADGVAVGDEGFRGDALVRPGGGVAGVDGGAHPRQGGVGGDEAGQAAGLVRGQGVHGVEDEGLDAGDPPGAGAQHVVEDGVEEGLGLARAGAGGDDGRLGAVAALGGQAPVGVLLVLVGGQARVPVEGAVGPTRTTRPTGPTRLVGLAGAVGGRARGQVGQAQAHEGADENALLLVLEEVGQRPPRLGVREREGRRQVVDDGAPDALGLKAGEEESHDRGVLVVDGGGSDSARERCPLGRRARRGFARIVVAPGQGSRRSEATAGGEGWTECCRRASPLSSAMHAPCSSFMMCIMTDMSVSAARSRLADVKVAEYGTLFLGMRSV